MNPRRLLLPLLLFVLTSLVSYAQQPPAVTLLTQKYVRVNSPRAVLAHVRVIDGTGKSAVDDQNVVIEGGKIVAVQPGADVAPSAGVTILDLHGYTVMPGIVGMHNHLYHIARPDLQADGTWEAPLRPAANDFLLAPPLSGCWRYDHAHHRQRRALCRLEPEEDD